MLQKILKTFLLLILLRLCKRIFGHHAQLRAHVEFDYLYSKHRVSTPLPEAVGAYFSPRLCRHRSLSLTPNQIIHSVSRNSISPYPLVPFVNVCAVVRCLLLLLRSHPGPVPLHNTPIYLRFVGHYTRG